jgi:hypothetical protein
MRAITVLVASLFLAACLLPDETADRDFAVYLLMDSTTTASEAYSETIESLVLANSPFVTVHDLDSYVWSTHAFALRENARNTFETFRLTRWITSGVPFVVAVGQERIYVGTFWWALSSSMPPPCAVIDATGPLPHRIELANGASDKRGDSRIYVSLKTAGVLREH